MAKKLKTINDYEDGCYLCGSYYNLQRHHALFGNANRKLCEEDGLCFWLCQYCHNVNPTGVHFNREKADYLKRIAQRIYEKDHTREEWRARYGRNYL